MRTCPQCQQGYPDDIEFCAQDGSLLPPPKSQTAEELTRGLAGKYRIIRELGRGGMGAVFLAEQILVGSRRVALKIMARKYLEDPEFLARFRAEAAVTGTVHHPNVVTVYEAGHTIDGSPYIAMEYLEGESLEHVLKRRGLLPVPEVVEINRQVACGLNATHKHGIIHRDLKPSNIFLTRDDESQLVVKVVDFGIAAAHRAEKISKTGFVLGTPEYMSPEQAQGMRGDELDRRSDIYSLGVVVYEMLTGRLPFVCENRLEYPQKHVKEQPPPFRLVKSDLPARDELERVVMKALEKKRENRYQSALEFALELAKAAESPQQEEAARKKEPESLVAEAEALYSAGKYAEAINGWEKALKLSVLEAEAAESIRAKVRFAQKKLQEQAAPPPPQPLPASRWRHRLSVAGNLAIVLLLTYAFAYLLATLSPSLFVPDGIGAHSPVAYKPVVVFGPAVVVIVCVIVALTALVRRRGEPQIPVAVRSWQIVDLGISLGSFAMLLAGVLFAVMKLLSLREPGDWTRSFVSSWLPLSLGLSSLSWAGFRALIAMLRGHSRLPTKPSGAEKGRLSHLRAAFRTTAAVLVAVGWWAGIVGVLWYQSNHDSALHTRFGRALLYDWNQRYAEAATEFRTAVRLKPDNAGAHFGLGLALEWAGDWGGALAELRETVRLRPDVEAGHAELGHILYQKGEIDEAITHFRQGTRLGTGFMGYPQDYYGELADALDKKGDVEGAINVYREAMQRPGLLSSPFDELIAYLKKKGRKAAVVAEYREFLGREPNNARAHEGFGNALRDKGDLNGAIAAYKEWVRVLPSDSDAHTYLGNALLDKGRVDAAITEYQAAIRLTPNSAWAHNGLGLALWRKGNVKGAIPEYQEAIRLDPNFKWPHYNLGLALEQQGDLRGALEEYRKAHQLDPKDADARETYERLQREVSSR